MRVNRYRRLAMLVCILAFSLSLRVHVVTGQERLETPPAGSISPREAVARGPVTELQAQIAALSTQMAKLAAEELRDREEIHDLRAQLLSSQLRADSPALVSTALPGYLRATGASADLPEPSTAQTIVEAQDAAIEGRLSRLEEDEQLTAANVREQSQTKVESGSKFRLRLSGMVLLNMFANRGAVDNLDVPEVALPPSTIDSGASFGGSLRQSQIGIEAFGPNIAGAHSSANMTLDFAGGLVDEQNGATKPLVRLRTGSIRMDWIDTSIVAGQDSLFFVPLTPSSLASLAVPALAYAGDLWSWTPQVRVERRLHLSQGTVLLQGGILDQLTGDVAVPGFERYPSWGEKSGQPAYAGRVAWSEPAFGDSFTLGVGGYYGHEYWGLNRHIDGWAATVDMSLPVGKLFNVSTAFYRGRAIGGLGGGIGQTVVANGPLSNPATVVQGLDSVGGWAQLKFKPTTKFEINAAIGDDNPFTGQLRQFPASTGYYGPLLSRNLSPFVNFIYRVRPDVLFSTEYRRIQTSALNSSVQKANLLNLSFGYTF